MGKATNHINIAVLVNLFVKKVRKFYQSRAFLSIQKRSLLYGMSFLFIINLFFSFRCMKKVPISQNAITLPCQKAQKAYAISFRKATVQFFSGLFSTDLCNRAFQLVVFKIGQKMAVSAVYVVICQSFCQSFYQRHLLAAIENNRLKGPIVE